MNLSSGFPEGSSVFSPSGGGYDQEVGGSEVK